MKLLDIFCIEDVVKIEWETITQTKCDFFRVEQSRDGHSYQVIGIVNGEGTTNRRKEYNFTKELANAHGLYRIVEIDFYGNETIHGPYISDCIKNTFEVTQNLKDDTVLITFNGFNIEETFIHLFDHTGTEVAINPVTSSGKQTISTSSLSSGEYTLVMRDDCMVRADKVFKL